VPPHIRQILITSTVAEQLSQSAKSDAEKGHDITLQQKFYDELLNARISLQKALLGLNSLPQGDNVQKYTDEATTAAINAAKQQAYTLFIQSFELRTVRSIHSISHD
jgi:protein AATF/BFR2